MVNSRHLLFALITSLASLVSVLGSGSADEAVDARVNGRVLFDVFSLRDGGGYKWQGSGVPHEIRFKKERILSKSPSGTYCNGVSFAVVMKSASELGLLASKSVAEVRAFQRDWYGATDASKEKQCVYAMLQLGIGKAIVPAQAAPGDFVQFWRGKGGHSAVFLGWITDDAGNSIGLSYRSSQKSTNGVGTKIEYFEGHGGHVNPARVYFCRLSAG